MVLLGSACYLISKATRKAAESEEPMEKSMPTTFIVARVHNVFTSRCFVPEMDFRTRLAC